MFSLLLVGLCVFSSRATAEPRVRRNVISRQFNSSDPYANWPSYSDLPLDPSYPTKAAWGVWGSDDIHGALNHITHSTISAAASEIKLGQAFNLNLEFSFIPRPINPERKPPVHLFQPGDGYTDDVITINTQQSTQYDSLKHFPYSDKGNTSTFQFYNDLVTDYEQVIGHEFTEVLGIQQAAEKGIAGRGVLLDFAGWAEEMNVTYNPLKNYNVTASDLDKVAEWQGLTGNWSKPGDLLFIRYGWIEAFGKLNETQKQEFVLGPGDETGVIANDETAKWLWDKKLALVAGDNPAFEAQPLSGVVDGDSRSMHEILIGGWGTSILEFVDTEKLAKALHGAGRSTFFVTIQTLNIKGGVASPPNAMAII